MIFEKTVLPSSDGLTEKSEVWIQTYTGKKFLSSQSKSRRYLHMKI